MFKNIALVVSFWAYTVLSDNPLGNLVEDTAGISVTFKMFTRQNSNGADLEHNFSKVDPNKLAIFISHGWHESSIKPWYGELTRALLKKYDCTVIQTDWTTLAQMEYAVSVQNTKIVGAKIGKTIQHLHKQQKVPLDKFWVIGHSLGGHVAGFAGKKVTELLKSKIAKIIGLDAAGPLFEFPVKVPPSQRLFNKDAKTVVNIHTDGGFLGYKSPIGTIDIFTNGGTRIQPGCKNLETLEHPTLERLLDVPTCSHAKSHEYYIRALNGEKITVTKCGSEADYKNGKCKNNQKLDLDTNFNEKENGLFYFTTTH